MKKKGRKNITRQGALTYKWVNIATITQIRCVSSAIVREGRLEVVCKGCPMWHCRHITLGYGTTILVECAQLSRAMGTFPSKQLTVHTWCMYSSTHTSPRVELYIQFYSYIMMYVQFRSVVLCLYLQRCYCAGIFVSMSQTSNSYSLVTFKVGTNYNSRLD